MVVSLLVPFTWLLSVSLKCSKWFKGMCTMSWLLMVNVQRSLIQWLCVYIQLMDVDMDMKSTAKTIKCVGVLLILFQLRNYQFNII